MKSARRAQTHGEGNIAGAMRARIDAGCFDEAVAIYDAAAARKPIGATLLRAYLLLKSDVPRAVELLMQHRREPMTDAERVEFLSLLGTANGLLGNYQVAEKYFLEAEPHLAPANDDRASAELRYRWARCRLLEGDTERARRLLRLLRESPDHLARIRALQLETTIDSIEQRYGDQATGLMRLLELLDAGKDEHVEVWAHSTHALAALSREMYLPAAQACAERELLKRPWPSEFAVNHFQALKALGWSKALQGDYFNAFRQLKMALESAPPGAWRVIAYLDRSYLARCLGETRWARQELAEAEELAVGVDWAATRGEERVGLLLLAEGAASVDAGQAAYYLAQYLRLGDVDPLMYLRHDDRLAALALYAQGVVQRELDDSRLATRMFKDSFATFDRIGYDWRAGRCALALFRATKEQRWLHVAQEKLKDYMHSWLGDELRELTPTPSENRVELTPVQSKVFQALAEGKSTDEIAALLGRSEFTVRNHIRLLLKAFGVNSRSALLAQAAKRGML